MSRVVVGSWRPPVIAPGAVKLAEAGGIVAAAGGPASVWTCQWCGEWSEGEPAELRVWSREHAVAHDALRPSVLGLDLSLTSAGIGLITRNALTSMPEVSAHVGAVGKQADSYADRNRRLVKQARAIMGVVDHCRVAGADIHLAVIEGPIYGMTGGHAFDRAALFWSVYSAVAARGIPVAVVTPSHREKFITGVTGHKQERNARKSRVLDETRALWAFPNGTEICRDPARCIVNDDEADALGLAAMGVLALKWPVPFQIRRRHVENVALVDWPVRASGVGA